MVRWLLCFVVLLAVALWVTPATAQCPGGCLVVAQLPSTDVVAVVWPFKPPKPTPPPAPAPTPSLCAPEACAAAGAHGEGGALRPHILRKVGKAATAPVRLLRCRRCG